MWAPGSYKNDGQRTTAPAPNIGIEKYFFEAGEKILKRIKDSRGTVILPERTGPIADVLYSAAGNSADDMWYRKGIISYSFETGADRFAQPDHGHGGDRRSASSRASARSAPAAAQGSCPANGSLVNEGRDEALEFAAGNFGMVESAYDYGKDVTAAEDLDRGVGGRRRRRPVNFRFNWDDEAAVIHYTTDGSTPTLASPTYNSQRARCVGEVLTITSSARHDDQVVRGRHQGQPVRGPDQARSGRPRATSRAPSAAPCRPTLSLTLGAPATFGAFTPGVANDYTASTTATVISTAGDATLSVADPSPTNTGKLVNGAFALPSRCRASASSRRGPLRPPTSRPGQFKQAIGANDAAAHGHVQQDADVHPEHDDPVVRPAHRSGRGVISTAGPRRPFSLSVHIARGLSPG